MCLSDNERTNKTKQEVPTAALANQPRSLRTRGTCYAEGDTTALKEAAKGEEEVNKVRRGKKSFERVRLRKLPSRNKD